MKYRIAYCLALVTALAFLPELGWAQGKKKVLARKHAELATLYYSLGEYKHAAEQFARAHELSGKAKYIYNAAQSYRLGGEPEQSLRAYEAYLELSPGGSGAESARQHIADIRADIEAREHQRREQERIQAEREARRVMIANQRAKKEATLQVRARTRWGLAMDTVIEHKGRGIAGQMVVVMSVAPYMDVRMAAILSRTPGVYFGGVAYPFKLGPGRAWKPTLGAGLPIFNNKGLRVGLRLCPGLEWQIKPWLNLAAGLGLEYIMNPGLNHADRAAFFVFGGRQPR